MMALREAVETESATTNVSSYDSTGVPLEDDLSDTSLKLGYNYFSVKMFKGFY